MLEHIRRNEMIEEVTVGSIWTHRNGNVYSVLMFTNTQDGSYYKYPPTVVYRNVHNGNNYSRKLSDWHGSMSLVHHSAVEGEPK